MSSALRAGSDTGEPSSLAFSFSKLETEARAGFFLFSLFRVCVYVHVCMFSSLGLEMVSSELQHNSDTQ